MKNQIPKRRQIVPPNRGQPWFTLPWFTRPWFTLPWFTLPWFTLPWVTLPWVIVPAALHADEAAGGTEVEEAREVEVDPPEGSDEDAIPSAGSSETWVERPSPAAWRATRIERSRLEGFVGGSIVDALAFQTGVRVENACSICNSTSVRVGGLPGAHTVVLIDGLPTLGALGSSYGLLLLDASLVESVNLLRGPSPAAAAGAATSVGTLDLRTRRAHEDFAEVRVEGGAPGLARLSAVAGLARPGGDTVAAWTLDHRAGLDRDGDGVTEQARAQRMQGALFARQRFDGGGQAQLRVQHQMERRQGGWIGDGFLDTFDSPRRALVESILTDRTEAALGWTHRVDDATRVSVSAVSARHTQDSDYGGEIYRATQWSGFGEARVLRRLPAGLRLEGGGSWQGEWLDENVGLDGRAWHQPGLFADLTWRHDHGELAVAARGDWHNVFGLFAVPSVRARWDLSPSWTLRSSAGRGARTPRTFFEQFQGVRPEGYQLVYSARRPEFTTTAALGLQGNVGPRWLLEVNAQWARIENAMTFRTDADTGESDEVGRVEVLQAEAPLDVASLEAEVTAFAWNGGELGAAWTFLVWSDPDGALVPPTSSHQGWARVVQRIDGLRSEIEVRGRVTGPADLRAVFGERYLPLGGDPAAWLVAEPEPGVAWDTSRPARDRSPWFGLVDVRLTVRPGRALDVWVGVDNLLDFHASDIEGPLFFAPTGNTATLDVISLWGPTRGRLVHGGLVWRL